MPASSGPTARPCTRADLGAVLALARADEERVTGRPSRLGEGDVRDWWQWVDLEADSWLVTAADGSTPAGAAWVDRPGGRGPGAGGLGVCFPMGGALAFLVETVEEHCRATGLARLHVCGLVPDATFDAVVRDRGFVEVRHFFEMAIQLDGRPEPAPLTDGLVVAPVTHDDVRAFHDATQDAFRDHWEHHERTFEEWWATRTSDPDLDLAWWFTVRDGVETAAAIRAVPARNGGVYVASLGVRRAYRGRGLGKALLHHVFARAWDAGYPRVTLGVDASSPTGATALYRSVGMTTELDVATWEKQLQP